MADDSVRPRVFKRVDPVTTGLGPKWDRPWKVFTPELPGEMQYPSWDEAMEWALLTSVERAAQIEEDFRMDGGW